MFVLIEIFFNNFRFQCNIGKLFEIFKIAFIRAAEFHQTEIVKFLIEQKRIDVNAKFFYFENFLFQSDIW